MQHYSALNGNELSSHGKTFRKLKCVLLNEGSQHDKATYCIIPTVKQSGKGKMLETVKDEWLPREG